MKSSTMVHNANQIALFFAHDEAVAGVVSHFKRFWERRMMHQIQKYVAEGGTGLHQLVLKR
jgi:hypothetical protein